MLRKILALSGVSVLALLLLVLSPVTVKVEPAVTNASTETIPADNCPEGSYSIGYDKDGENHICKLEPTGCPWGDSIPVDSPKCTPPPDITCNEDWTKCEPKKENEGNNVEDSSEVRDTRSTPSKEEQSNGSCSSK